MEARRRKNDQRTRIKEALVSNLILIRRKYRYQVAEMCDVCGVSAPTMRKYLENPELMTIGSLISISNLTGFPVEALMQNIIGSDTNELD